MLRNIRAFRSGYTLTSRSITTSDKKSDHGMLVPKAPAPPPVTAKDFSKGLTNRNWVSYGFDELDRTKDENNMNLTFFCIISIFFCGYGFYLSYAPDGMLRDWSCREAFLELRRRESLGLPLIDPNYVDPATIVLPSDEELGDTEIII